jgi:hypothetical protein
MRIKSFTCLSYHFTYWVSSCTLPCIDQLEIPWSIHQFSIVLFNQELPERLLLTYKPEESEEIPEPAPVEEEKAPVEEPEQAPPVTEVVSPPPKAEVPNTGDLLVGKRML